MCNQGYEHNYNQPNTPVPICPEVHALTVAEVARLKKQNDVLLAIAAGVLNVDAAYHVGLDASDEWSGLIEASRAAIANAEKSPPVI